MSDELATDEADADEFEVDTLHHDRLEAEERADGKDGAPSGYGGVNRDDVVFDIGDEGDESDDDVPHSHTGRPRKSNETQATGEDGSRLRLSGYDSRSLPPRYSSLS